MMQNILEPTADAVQKAVSGAFEGGGETGQKIKDALHGTWLGHPLHPALTDVPLGAWTAAMVLDAAQELNGDPKLAAASDAAVAVGIAGAVAAAVTGVTDWQATDGEARRQGLIHGLLNTAGLLLYSGSLVARRKGARSTGLSLSLLGFAAAASAAWIGGHLVYRKGVGVDHTVGQAYPQDWKSVMSYAELYENQLRRVDVDGSRILLWKRDGRVHAIGETCSHLGGPLAEGKIEDCTVTCPWHGSCFSLEDGSVVHGPATHPQPKFDVRIRHQQIEVRLTPPAAE